jgi:serine/threonine protein kinase
VLGRGDRLGDYEIVSEPMEGTTTCVFEVRHVETQKRAALKLLQEQWRWLPDVVTRFHNERRILSSLNHPNIIALWDSGDDAAGAPFMVLEWLPRTLQESLAAEPLPPQQALRCASQIAAALSALHAQGLVHRELKPKDILMGSQPLEVASLKLADVGFAKAPSEGRVTPPEASPYLAPEQWRVGEPVDGAADVYALGALLFQMLSGRLPFLAPDPQGLMYQHMFEAPPLVQLPDAARVQTADLLYAMLAKRADERPRMVEVCQQLLHMQASPAI